MVDFTPSFDSSLRKGIQEYIKACEHLLYSPASDAHVPLSSLERQVLFYYADELYKHLLAPKAH